MIVLYNANINTLDQHLPHAQALAIQDGRIVALGSDDEILAVAPPGTKRFNLAGKTIWPGLTDAHLHLENYALALQRIDCETATQAECLARVNKVVLEALPDVWVRGHGWNQNVWPEGFGNAHQLDQLAPHNPVYLTAKSLHAGWANSAALRLAGIDANTPDPPGGRILRSSDGKPTGILFESAMGLVEEVIPAATLPEVRQAIAAAQKSLWALGITGIHDFDRRTCFIALQQLDQTGELRLRVLKSIPLESLDQAAGLGLQTGFGNDRLRIGSIKCFADGALGPQTAAMLSPYENTSSDTGLLFLDAEEIVEIGQQAAESGLSLAIHAIGDRANHEVLKAYAQIRQFEGETGRPHLRHRIEHVQVLHADHLNRLAELGVIASMQPIHATSDMDIANRFWGARSRYAYAFQTLLQAGTRLAFGSDAPVESPNPFWGLHAAVTRRRQDGTPDSEGWYPQERLALKSALESYTVHPAFAAGWEKQLGRLAPGYLADLIVLDQDPFDLPPHDLYHLKPSAVMFAGEWVMEGE